MTATASTAIRGGLSPETWSGLPLVPTQECGGGYQDTGEEPREHRDYLTAVRTALHVAAVWDEAHAENESRKKTVTIVSPTSANQRHYDTKVGAFIDADVAHRATLRAAGRTVIKFTGSGE